MEFQEAIEQILMVKGNVERIFRILIHHSYERHYEKSNCSRIFTFIVYLGL